VKSWGPLQETAIEKTKKRRLVSLYGLDMWSGWKGKDYQSQLYTAMWKGGEAQEGRGRK